MERNSWYERLQKVLQGYYLQAYETKHRRHCNRQKKPQKLTERDKRNILQQVEILRRDYVYFTTKRLKVFAGVSADVSDETVR